MGGDSHLRGQAAERAAVEALEAASFRVVETNYRVTGAEIDVVARDADGLVFVEVRARSHTAVDPSATIDTTKFRSLRRGARSWLTRHDAQAADWRFVVVAVSLAEDGRPVGTEIIEDPFQHLPEFHHGDP